MSAFPQLIKRRSVQSTTTFIYHTYPFHNIPGDNGLEDISKLSLPKLSWSATWVHRTRHRLAWWFKGDAWRAALDLIRPYSTTGTRCLSVPASRSRRALAL